MCYRVARDFSDVDVIKDSSFMIDKSLTEFRPKFNVAITESIPVIISGSRILDLYKWGLIPRYSKDISIGSKLGNARAETILEKPSFKENFKERRCLVLASGFFEWDEKKNPHYIQVKSRKILAFAGLWDEWKSSNFGLIRSCTIITSEPNEFIKIIHDRMPVILEPLDFEMWLSGKDLDGVLKILGPYKGDLNEYEVTRKMNSVKYENSDAIKPINL